MQKLRRPKRYLYRHQRGMSIRFKEDDVRAMGRNARGVKGMTVGKTDVVIGMEVIEKGSKTLF